MKRILYLFIAMFTVFATVSCDKDDDNLYLEDAVATFKAKYPGVNAHWEKEYGKLKAEFLNEGKEAEAWFETDGTWLFTETDFRGTFPAAVQSYLDLNYEGYVVDDADWIETPETSYFRIELEKRMQPEAVVLIKEDGTLIEQ